MTLLVHMKNNDTIALRNFAIEKMVDLATVFQTTLKDNKNGTFEAILNENEKDRIYKVQDLESIEFVI